MAVDYNEIKSFWLILFQLRGSVWIEVLPYCIINVILALSVYFATKSGFGISFSPGGHALMSLIISFLVVSKVNLALDRYMNARSLLGQALSLCREINQHAVVFTQDQTEFEACRWRADITRLTLILMSKTVQAIKEHEKALTLVKGDCRGLAPDDPMTYAMLLRSKVYTSDDNIKMTPLERLRILDIILRYVETYQGLIKPASTPLPFPMVQMGRTCLFLWIFSLPLVLVGVFDEILSVLVFIFFLTYGFIGMELVAMQLINPFGDEINDLGVDSMAEAAIQCIQNDVGMRGGGEPDKYNPPPEHPNKQPESPYVPLEVGTAANQLY